MGRVKHVMFIAVVFSLYLCSFCSFSGKVHAASLLDGMIRHGGAERSYSFYIPETVRSGDRNVPMVLVLHGGGGNGESAARMTGFAEKAEVEGFIAVFPDGTGRFPKMNRLKTWNAGHCCGYAMNNRVDDVGFISALIDHFVEEYPVDAKRVYVTGLSNGGMMTHRIGRELPGKVAAIAPVIAGLFGDEQEPAMPVPAFMINGALDKSIPTEGGLSGGRFADAWDGTPLKPVEYQGEFWAEANGCKPAAKNSVKNGANTIIEYGCPEGGKVRQVIVGDNGHAWPGGQKGSPRGDQPSGSFRATDEIWAFFKKHFR